MNIRSLFVAIGALIAVVSPSLAGITNTYNSGYTDLGGGIYYGGGQNSYLVVSNSAVLVSTATILGFNPGDDYASAVVTGNNSTWSNNLSYILVGYNAASNSITVSNGGKLIQAIPGNGDPRLMIGYGTGGNKLTVTGSNSLVNSGEITIGSSGGANEMLISDGAVVVNPRTWLGAYTDNNRITVTGPNSVLSNTAVSALLWGYYGSGNEAIVSNGGTIVSGYQLYLGYQPTSASNSVTITGAGSLFRVPVDVILHQGYGTKITIADGGRMESYSAVVGNSASATNLAVTITGANSIWALGGYMAVGNSAYSAGGGRVLVENGGTLDLSSLYSGASGSGIISNRGGIFQFPTATPTIVNNDVAGNSIVSQNGTISFRGIVNAPTSIGGTVLTNIAFSGNTGFKLNNASNAFVSSYTFNSGNPTNYQRLTLANNSRWRSGNLTVGTGGAIKGGAGDVVEVTTNFTILRVSNVSADFDLSASTVTFTGGGSHTNAITGSDLGHSATLGYADGFTAVNFAYGKLTLGGSDQLYFTQGDGGASSNALYLFNLDLGGNTNLISHLHAPSNINIYYALSSWQPANAYLNDLVYTLDGGGLLMPAIPEPTTMLLIGAGLAALLRRRR